MLYKAKVAVCSENTYTYCNHHVELVNAKTVVRKVPGRFWNVELVLSHPIVLQRSRKNKIKHISQIELFNEQHSTLLHVSIPEDSLYGN